jgi:hypothetical protein
MPLEFGDADKGYSEGRSSTSIESIKSRLLLKSLAWDRQHRPYQSHLTYREACASGPHFAIRDAISIASNSLARCGESGGMHLSIATRRQTGLWHDERLTLPEKSVAWDSLDWLHQQLPQTDIADTCRLILCALPESV